MELLVNIIKLVIFVGYVITWGNILIRLSTDTQWLGLFFGLFIVLPASFGLQIPYGWINIVIFIPIGMIVVYKWQKLEWFKFIFSLEGLIKYWATTCLLICLCNLIITQGKPDIIAVLLPLGVGCFLIIRSYLPLQTYCGDENNL